VKWSHWHQFRLYDSCKIWGSFRSSLQLSNILSLLGSILFLFSIISIFAKNIFFMSPRINEEKPESKNENIPIFVIHSLKKNSSNFPNLGLARTDIFSKKGLMFVHGAVRWYWANLNSTDSQFRKKEVSGFATLPDSIVDEPNWDTVCTHKYSVGTNCRFYNCRRCSSEKKWTVRACIRATNV